MTLSLYLFLHLQRKKIWYMYALQHQRNKSADTTTWQVWCGVCIPDVPHATDTGTWPWQWWCSRHSALKWKCLNAVACWKMNSGIRRGRLVSLHTWTNTIFWVVVCDVMEPTWLQCATSTFTEEDTMKAMKMIDCARVKKKKVFSPDTLAFQNRFKEGVISLCLIFLYLILPSYRQQREKKRASHMAYWLLYSILTELLKQPCVLNPDKSWLLMTFLKAGIKSSWCISVLLHLDAMTESSFYSSDSQEAQTQLLGWNGEAQTQKATTSALTGDCHQQFGLEEWLHTLKCLCAS